MKLFGNTIRRVVRSFRQQEPTAPEADRESTDDLTGAWFLVEMCHLSVLGLIVFFLGIQLRPVLDLLLPGNEDVGPYLVGILWGIACSYAAYHFYQKVGQIWRESVMPHDLEMKIARAISPYFGHKLGWAIRTWRGE